MRKVAGLLSLLTLVPTVVHAAWLGPSGNPVAPTFHGDPVTLFNDGTGGVFVAYQGLSVPGGGAIRLQHVLGDGTIAPGWPAEGAVACSLAVTTPLGELRAIGDGASGAFLLWNENPGYVNLSGTFYVQHLLANGARAPGWPARGRLVTTGGTVYSPESAADGAGGLFLVFGAGGGYRSMRIRSDGSNAPGYPATGRPLLTPSGPSAIWSGASLAPAHGGGFWLSALLAGTDSLASPWSYRLWRLDASGALDLTWGGDDGQGVRIPLASSALATGYTDVLDDGTDGAFLLVSVGARETVTHVLSDQALDPAWPAPLLDLGANDLTPPPPAGQLALDGAGGLFALWPASFTGPQVGLLRRARMDGTLDPDWASVLTVSPSYQPTLLADAAGVFAGGARMLSCPEEDCTALSAVGRWSTDGSTPAGWPPPSPYTFPGEYPLPDSAYGGVVGMVRDGEGGVFVAWTAPDPSPFLVYYGAAATVRVMRFAALGPVAGVGDAPAGPLAFRGARYTREGIRCSVSGDRPAELTVFDLLGRRLTRVQLEPGTRESLVPGTSALPPGLYLVRARTRAAEAHAKLLVVR